ncbi:MAG TPA: UDP-N-acetylglucosamine 2-epimerase, partial [Bacillota bacterium]|nr:UDP-N-acetylglucosamine 2-epimerase [Bacillota bacterium]
EGVDVIQPLDYLKLMGLVMHSAFVITDSGGLQKEAYFCGKRSPVVMPDTGWRELVDIGWNMLIRSTEDFVEYAHGVSRTSCSVQITQGDNGMLGTGDAAQKIAYILRG